MAEPGWKEALAQGRPLDPRSKLSPELLIEMGIHKDVVESVLSTLKKNGCMTWGSLLGLETKAEAIEVAEDEVNGRRLWSFIEGQRALRRGTLSSPPLTVHQLVANYTFPSEIAAFEFPDLHLDATNPSAESIKGSGLKADWKLFPEENVPDFLVSNLHEPITRLRELSWDEESRQIRLAGVKPADFAMRSKHHTVIVSTSGSGKTRFIYEQAYKSFAIVFPGDDDDLLLTMRRIELEMDEEKLGRPQARSRIDLAVCRILAIRYAVLDHLRKLFGEAFKPRHWLALQLFPYRITGRDLFWDIGGMLSDAAVPKSLSSTTGIKFVALDEAQALDCLMKGVFAGAFNSGSQSVLGPITDALIELKATILLAGTRLSIESVINFATRSIAKTEGPQVQLYGTTFEYTPSEMRSRFLKWGLSDEVRVNEKDLEYFRGRPRFAMRLLCALLLQSDIEETARQIRDSIKKDIYSLKLNPAVDDSSNEEQTKMLFQAELVCAAVGFILHGEGHIFSRPDVALEIGVCGVFQPDAIPSQPPQQAVSYQCRTPPTTFKISEPLVAHTLEEVGLNAVSEITIETAVQIGYMLKDLIAINAASVVKVLMSEDAGLSLSEEFRGPWVLPSPLPSRRRGQGTLKSGDEPALIEGMITVLKSSNDCAALSILFPSTDMGADVVILARGPNDRILLLFVHAKASIDFSTEEVLQCLRHPYCTNRDQPITEASVPERSTTALTNLEKIMARPDVSVVFMVFKYPARSQSGVAEFRSNQYESPFNKKEDGSQADEGKELKIDTLEVVLDESNAQQRMPDLNAPLAALKKVKHLDQSG